MTKNNDNKSSIQLEDLLRFKKHERPDDAFWARFDEQLHKKTLQALVRPEPISVRLLRKFKALVTPGLALPAFAMLMLFTILLGTKSGFYNQTSSTELEVAVSEQPISVNMTPNTVSQASPTVLASAIPIVDASVQTRFVSNAMNAEGLENERFTKIRATQALLSGLDDVRYVASSYTTGSNSYASMPMNTVY